jgi:hypothetical protein
MLTHDGFFYGLIIPCVFPKEKGQDRVELYLNSNQLCNFSCPLRASTTPFHTEFDGQAVLYPHCAIMHRIIFVIQIGENFTILIF